MASRAGAAVLALCALTTGAYTVEPKKIDKRGESIVAADTMHIVAFELLDTPQAFHHAVRVLYW